MEEFNILVCDDDHSIVDAIEIYLKQMCIRDRFWWSASTHCPPLLQRKPV